MLNYLILMAGADVEHGHGTVGCAVPSRGHELLSAHAGRGHGWWDGSCLTLGHGGWRGLYQACDCMHSLLGGVCGGQIVLDLLPLRLANVVVCGVLKMGLHL